MVSQWVHVRSKLPWFGKKTSATPPFSCLLHFLVLCLSDYKCQAWFLSTCPVCSSKCKLSSLVVALNSRNWSVSRSVHQFGPDCNIYATTLWIAFKFFTHIHDPQTIMPLIILCFFLLHHHELHICGSEWNNWAISWIAIKSGIIFMVTSGWTAITVKTFKWIQYI